MIVHDSQTSFPHRLKIALPGAIATAISLPRSVAQSAALLVVAALLCLMAATAPGQAADQTPSAFLKQIYKQYVGKNTPGVVLDTDADIQRYFTPSMAKIIIDDDAKAEKSGDIPTLDGDPFVGHQDWQITKFKVDVDDQATDKTSAKVSLTDLGKIEVITVDLVKVDGAWKIDDVHWTEDSLRGIYKQ
jgi:hypothetical protein